MYKGKQSSSLAAWSWLDNSHLFIWEKSLLEQNWVACDVLPAIAMSWASRSQSYALTWVGSIYGRKKGWICWGSIVNFNHITGQSLEDHKLTKENCKERSSREEREQRTMKVNLQEWRFTFVSIQLIQQSLQCVVPRSAAAALEKPKPWYSECLFLATMLPFACMYIFTL